MELRVSASPLCDNGARACGRSVAHQIIEPIYIVIQFLGVTLAPAPPLFNLSLATNEEIA